MKALILAAGLGTRLRPLTEVRAKPALPVVGVPSLWFGAWHLKTQLRVSQFAINVSHLPDTVREAANDPDLRAHTGIHFTVSDESGGLLGSSGALWKLKEWVGSESLAVCNGDSICFPSWVKMAELHRRSSARLTLHVRAFEGGAEPYTDLDVGADGKVRGFKGKASSGIMFAGNYLIEPELLERLPAGASELRPTLLEPLVREGALYAYREDVDWFDTGTVASYAQAQFDLLRAAPIASQLVGVKMREEQAGCWVPRSWNHTGKPALRAPVIMTGTQEEWLDRSAVYGPRFIGIEPPPPGVDLPFESAVVLSSQIQRL